jgi:hypothetical protein
MPNDKEHDDLFDFNLADVIQKIADKAFQQLNLEKLASNVDNLGHLRTIADALAAQVIVQHGTDEDRKRVVERLKQRFFS